MLILAYFILLNAFTSDTFSEAYDVIEWICIGTMLTSILILVLLNTSRSVYQLAIKIRRWRKSAQVYDQSESDLHDTQQLPKLNQTTTQSNYQLENSDISNREFPKFYDALSRKQGKIA
jgi:hypothetical protein